MLNYQIDVLDRKLPFFLENINLDTTFFAHVRAEKLLTDESINEIEIQPTEGRRIIKFIDFLKKQAPKKFNIFLGILKKTEQHHVFKEINFARHQKIKHLPKSPDVDKNTKDKLVNDFNSFRLLSTTERDYLTKHFILRSDYEEINEDKHILRSENIDLQQQLNNVKEAEEYESKHHQLLRDEYGKLKNDMEKINAEFKKQLWKITELKNEILEQECREREYKKNISDFTCQIAQLTQEITAIQNENATLKTDATYKNTSASDIEMVTSIQLQIESLRNISKKYTTADKPDEELLDLCSNLENLKNSTADILIELKPSMEISFIETVNPEICFEQADVIEDVATQVKAADNLSNVVQKHIPHKPKHPKSASHHRERKRVVILETELSELKNRLKKIEGEKNQQSVALQQKEKQLLEEQKQIIFLRKILRDLKSHSQPQSRGSSVESLSSPCIGQSNILKIPPINSDSANRKLAWKKQQPEETKTCLPKAYYNVKTLVVQNQNEHINLDARFNNIDQKRKLSLDFDSNHLINDKR